jgi:hypothetical protein
LNLNFQLGTHPDADQLSVFIEGAATSREQERMLAHLAECAECRKAAFLMQPHEEPQPATPTPVKGWIWGRLVPIGLPAAALACGLIAVLIYIRPHGAAPSNPQQIASVKAPDIQPQTTVAPTTDADKVAQSVRPKNTVAPGTAAIGLSRQESPVAGYLNLPESKRGQAGANAAPQTTATAPSASVQTAGAALAQNSISSATISNLPLKGRDVTNLQQLSTPPDAKAAASQNSLAMKKDLPALEIERASGQAETLAGVSGRITDRTGAVIAGATVTLRDVAGKARQMTTSADGSFHLTDLPAGKYELIATASGFKTNRQSIELKPSEFAMLQPTLDIGAVTEAVEVEAASGAVSVQTESANVGSQIIPLPSGLPVAGTVSHGKRFLSLDDAGNLFLSRNEGKKWKKIKPQWAGKAVRIELTPAYSSEAPPKPKNETLGKANEEAVFLLTTDSGTVWTSKDGAHWHQ